MEKNKFVRTGIILSAVSAALNAALLLASRLSAGFSEWYAVNVYPVWINIIARATGLFKFSVVEILIFIFIPAALFLIIFTVIRLAKGRGKRVQIALKAILFTFCAASLTLLSFMLNCGVNYNRDVFLNGAVYGDYDRGSYSAEEIRAVYHTVVAEFDAVLPLVRLDGNGNFILTSDLSVTAPKALSKLSEKYPRLDTYYPRPKPVMISKIMSSSGILGIYSPFTIEANYNNDAPDSEKPFSVCHELAHLAGFMKEEEANFISFLACRESGDPDLMYSAYLTVIERLADEYQPDESGKDARSYLPPQARGEMAMIDDYWRKMLYREDKNGDGEIIMVLNPVVEFSEQINDDYLKANGQEEGVSSYRLMVDLVLSFYLEEVM